MSGERMSEISDYFDPFIPYPQYIILPALQGGAWGRGRYP
jgi:hypothetical protein